MSYRVMAPEFETLVDQKEPIQTVAGEFIFTEGPVWHPVETISCCSRICRATSGGDGMPRAASSRSSRSVEQMQRHDL